MRYLIVDFMAEDKHKMEEELNRLLFIQNVYNQQYEAVMGELTSFSMAQAALRRNIHLLESKDRVKGSEILVNAEGGTYIEAALKDMKKVITYVGAGYLVDKEVGQAKEFLTKSLESSETQLKKLAEDKQKLENELMRIQYELERLQQQEQQG
jgi:prefoldin alpha subunit